MGHYDGSQNRTHIHTTMGHRTERTFTPPWVTVQNTHSHHHGSQYRTHIHNTMGHYTEHTFTPPWVTVENTHSHHHGSQYRIHTHSTMGHSTEHTQHIILILRRLLQASSLCIQLLLLQPSCHTFKFTQKLTPP